MHTVGVLLVDGVNPFELAVACEVFGLPRPELGVPWYRFLVCAAEDGTIRTSSGFTVHTPHGLGDLGEADTIIVTDWHRIEEPVPVPITEALRQAFARGTRLVSFCSGAFLLAAAGLLDGRRATTHWMWAEELAARHPAIRLEPAVLYVDDGQILTSAGTAAAIDLSLHIVRSDYGQDVANAVARRMVVAPHRDGGQAQYVERRTDAPGGTDPIAPVLAWASERLGEPLTIERMATVARMSPRTFARRFRDATGTTPYRWLLGQRLAEAKALLERTELSVELVARDAGFGSATNLRAHFRRSVGTSPSRYRRAFEH